MSGRLLKSARTDIVVLILLPDLHHVSSAEKEGYGSNYHKLKNGLVKRRMSLKLTHLFIFYDGWLRMNSAGHTGIILENNEQTRKMS